MISIVALVVGLLGMFTLWTLAWQLWQQALALEPPATAGDSSSRVPNWHNEPTPDRQLNPVVVAQHVAPDQQEERTEIEESPVARMHPNSDANTAFFSRADLQLLEMNPDKTEILQEEIFEVVPQPASQPATRRKTKFFPGPPKPPDPSR